MEKVVRGEGDGEVWLVEGWRGIQRGWKGSLVALMWTFEAVLAKQKQSGWVHYRLLVAYLAVVALLFSIVIIIIIGMSYSFVLMLTSLENYFRPS